MSQRVVQWSSPWILQNSIRDPNNPPWEAPRESELVYDSSRMTGSTPFSTSFQIQNDFYSNMQNELHKPSSNSPRNSFSMGFYPGQAYMTPGYRPGVGGGWRAFESEFSRAVPGCILQGRTSTGLPYCRLRNM
uniref:Uncharacterized protein n=1 Tax=viral metagenome TaxID=1070528 RepID=A0A6C0BZR3_9ZZZZ